VPPVLVSTIFSLACLLGFTAIVILLVNFKWMTKRIHRIGELPIKLGLDGLQLFFGFTGIYCSFFDAEVRSNWIVPIILSFVGAGIWKFVQIIVDLRLKSESARAAATSEILGRLLIGIRDGVSRKTKRVQDAVRRDRRPQTTIVHVRETLTPNPHLNDLLDQLALVLRRDASSVFVRVGVYVNRTGTMEPVHGVSLKNPGYNPFTSHKSNPAFFRVDAADNTSHVVKCVQEKRTILVSDCRKESEIGTFSFADCKQSEYLKSLVVYHLGEVMTDEGHSTEAVIAVDADYPGFFSEAAFSEIQQVLGEFGLRIQLEMAMIAFLERRGATT